MKGDSNSSSRQKKKRDERYLRGPRLLSAFDPEGDTARYVSDNLTDFQLEANHGAGATAIARLVRTSVEPKSAQEAVRLLFEDFRCV